MRCVWNMGVELYKCSVHVVVMSTVNVPVHTEDPSNLALRISDVKKMKAGAAYYYTSALFICGIFAVYLFAFASFYQQLPGLWGENGIVPLDQHVKHMQASQKRGGTVPSIVLWLVGRNILGTRLQAHDAAALVTLLAIACATLGGFVRGRKAGVFALLCWVCLLSLAQVSTVFLWYQWELLLLETGVLFIVLLVFGWTSVTTLLIEFLLFRLMFASGAVKLNSNCKFWWSLRALECHFASQPLPSPGSWWANLAVTRYSWLGKAGVAGTLLIECVFPFFMVLPRLAWAEVHSASPLHGCILPA